MFYCKDVIKINDKRYIRYYLIYLFLMTNNIKYVIIDKDKRGYNYEN